LLAKAAKTRAWRRSWPHGYEESNGDSGTSCVMHYNESWGCGLSPEPRYRSFLEGRVRVNGDRTRFDVYGYADRLISNRKKPVVS
jgi:hypothetical protein